jgi:hypothetical protein
MVSTILRIPMVLVQAEILMFDPSRSILVTIFCPLIYITLTKTLTTVSHSVRLRAKPLLFFSFLNILERKKSITTPDGRGR